MSFPGRFAADGAFIEVDNTCNGEEVDVAPPKIAPEPGELRQEIVALESRYRAEREAIAVADEVSVRWGHRVAHEPW